MALTESPCCTSNKDMVLTVSLKTQRRNMRGKLSTGCPVGRLCRIEPRCVSTGLYEGSVGAYLGNLGPQVPVLHLDVTLLPQSRGQRRVLRVQQSLQVFDPLQRSGQLGLLLGVPATERPTGSRVSNARRRQWLCLQLKNQVETVLLQFPLPSPMNQM